MIGNEIKMKIFDIYDNLCCADTEQSRVYLYMMTHFSCVLARRPSRLLNVNDEEHPNVNLWMTSYGRPMTAYHMLDIREYT